MSQILQTLIHNYCIQAFMKITYAQGFWWGIRIRHPIGSLISSLLRLFSFLLASSRSFPVEHRSGLMLHLGRIKSPSSTPRSMWPPSRPFCRLGSSKKASFLRHMNKSQTRIVWDCQVGLPSKRLPGWLTGGLAVSRQSDLAVPGPGRVWESNPQSSIIWCRHREMPSSIRDRRIRRCDRSTHCPRSMNGR